jgi:hypothetical protein
VVQQLLIDLHSVVIMFLCEHPWDSPGVNFAIFQSCQHRFQRTEVHIQLRTQFPVRNPKIRADLLIRRSSFLGLTAVQGRPERGLSHRCRHC